MILSYLDKIEDRDCIAGASNLNKKKNVKERGEKIHEAPNIECQGLYPSNVHGLCCFLGEPQKDKEAALGSSGAPWVKQHDVSHITFARLTQMLTLTGYITYKGIGSMGWHFLKVSPLFCR